MASQFVFPSNVTLQEIERVKLPVLMQGRACFDFASTQNVDSHLVEWEQKDSYGGLQALRGLDGRPHSVVPLGASRFQYAPGIYGDQRAFNEAELTRRRAYGTFGTPIDLSDMVMDAQEYLYQRYLDRVEYLIWQATSGTITVLGPNGVPTFQDTFASQQYTSSVAFSDHNNATPLQNFRDVVLLGRGTSNDIPKGTAYMNRKTFNNIAANQNSADIFGQRTAGLATIQSLGDVNKVMLNEGLPEIQIYEGNYLTGPSGGNPVVAGPAGANMFIPDNKVIVVGKRPGNAPAMRYLLTRNAQNPSLAPGMYTKVIDTIDREVPRKVEVHCGHNGGVALSFPSAFIYMNV